MVTVFDVAKYILERQGRISTWKLQKLCYYAQAWSLAWTERPLFYEEIQAWANGPVCPDLFREHKGKFLVGPEDLTRGNSDALDEDQKDTIDKVLAHYGGWEPYQLREQTHHEDPWRLARVGVPEDGPSSREISRESMGAYYGGL